MQLNNSTPREFLPMILLRTFGIFAALLFYASIARAQDSDDPRNVTQLYDRHGIAIVAKPDHLYAALLNAHDSPRTRYHLVPAENQRQISALLLSSHTYDWQMWKPCAPLYLTRLVFQRGDESVSVDFCFDCNIITSGDSKTKPVKNAYFDPSHPVLLKWFKIIFPKDRELRDVK
jgi:hypothetical protein